MMTKRQAYYTLYFLFDKEYFELYPNPGDEEEVFGFGELLSCMCPYIWADHRSGDPATAGDFTDCWEQVGAGDVASEEKALEACFAFINLHITEWEFKLDEALDCLKSVDWKEAARKFCALYPTDDMDIPNDNPFVEDDEQGELFDDEES